MMKALQLTRPHLSAATPPVLSLTTLPTPILKPGYALVKIHFSSIHPSDKLNSKGSFPMTTYPRIPGRDYSGTVLDIASESEKSWIGKAVYGSSGATLGFEIDGPHAEFCLVPEEALVEKPSTLSFLQAATVGVPYTTAYLTLKRARTTKDDVVLVLGANGAVGSSAVQIARAIGCKRVLTATRREAGDTPDVDLTSGIPETVLRSTIPALTDGRGVDVIIDTVGSIALMSAAIKHLARCGRYSWIAAPRGGVSTDLTFDIFQAYRDEIELVGCNTGNYSVTEVAQDMRVLKEWFDSGIIKSRDEGVFEIIDLDNAVEKGYGGEAGKLIVVALV
jgi:NADPH:quinone reductase